MNKLIKIRNVIPVIYESPFHNPLNWSMNEDEVWTITGRNGSGKTLFAEVIAGNYNLRFGSIDYYIDKKRIRTVSFNSMYSLDNFRKSYYQQRFNQIEIDKSPLVNDLLSNRRLIQLSSGELRKLLITRILQENYRLIIFDNPFIGLDILSQQQLDETFHQLHQQGIQLIFLASSLSELPSVTTHILDIRTWETINCPFPQQVLQQDTFNINVDWKIFPKLLLTSETVVKMENVSIQYGEEIIVKDINWEIKHDEKWALLGPNGSGKSTLLSYIFADNPQGYNKNLTLFDHRRGTGESIWDIKKRIGFTSSEMHFHYRMSIPCLKVVQSGFFDSIGLYQKCNSEQICTAEYVMDILQIAHLKDRSFLRISFGEQRLILFARSLVKNPELLILDEPFHGLDEWNKQRCLQIIELYGQQSNKALIFVTHKKEEIPKSVEKIMHL